MKDARRMETETQRTVEQLTGLAALGEDAELLSGRSIEFDNATQIGNRLAAARRAANMTGSELGEHLGLRKDQVSKIESGKRRLDVSELARAAAALGVSVRHLLGQPDRPGLAVAARLANGVAPAATRGLRRRARQLLELDDLLTQVADLPAPHPTSSGARVLSAARGDFSRTPRTKVAARRQGRELAEMTRRELDLGGDTIADLAAVIEQHFGVDVALSPMGTQADGLCVHSGPTALILASSDYPDGHLRFTLAHELGHHLLGDPREAIEEQEHQMFADTIVESRANAFAGHLLLPERGVESFLSWLGEGRGNLTDRGLVALMEHFGVSHAALTVQLNMLDWLTYDEGRQLREDTRVHAIVAAHADVAATGAATAVRRVRRSPERLTRAALAAARSQRLGLSVVAALLEREDDDELWEYVMGSDLEGLPKQDRDSIDL